MKTQTIFLIPLLGTALTLGGCLKTRAQLKKEREEGTPARVESVEPAGRYVIDEIKSELTQMTGRIEELERAQKERAENESVEQAEKLAAYEKRIEELEQTQLKILERFKAEEKKRTEAKKDPAKSFKEGKNLFSKAKYKTAIEKFTLYLKTRDQQFVQRATWLRAESHFLLKNYKKAILDYSKFPEKFRKSRRVRSSLYKIGLSFEKLGMKEDAVAFYQELVAKYPKSSEAKKAAKRMK